MKLRVANDVIIIRVLQKKIIRVLPKKSRENCNFHFNCFTR